MDRKIFSWGLYDFANSIILANLTLYLSQWIVVDNGFADIWYTGPIALATILLILTAPFFGIHSDKTKKRMWFIIPISIFVAVLTVLMGIFGASQLTVFNRMLIVVILFLLIEYFYQLALVFYDALLGSLTSAKNYGKISGFGGMMDNLGWIFGLLLTFLFVSGSITLFGTPGRIQAFVPSGIFFFLLTIPMLIFIKDKVTKLKTDIKIKQIYHQTLTELKSLIKNKNILLFLVAFYFIADATQTAQIIFPIYFEEVLLLSDMSKIIVLVAMLIFIAVGAVLFGRLADTFGLKKTLVFATASLIISFILIPLFTNVPVVLAIIILSGLFWGGYFAVARSLLTYISPKQKLGKSFSFFTIFRRTASVVGPLIWGVTVFVFSSLGPAKYKIAVYPLVFLAIIGLFLLTKVKEIQK